MATKKVISLTFTSDIEGDTCTINMDMPQEGLTLAGLKTDLQDYINVGVTSKENRFTSLISASYITTIKEDIA